MIPELEKCMNISFPTCSYDSDEMRDFLINQCQKCGITPKDEQLITVGANVG